MTKRMVSLWGLPLGCNENYHVLATHFLAKSNPQDLKGNENTWYSTVKCKIIVAAKIMIN
jgi:hypothetical protein